MIYDFTPNTTNQSNPNGDIIDLSVIDAVVGTPEDEAFSFELAQNIGVIEHTITWFTENNKTIIQGDVNGDTVADFQIELAGQKPVTEAAFIL